MTSSLTANNTAKVVSVVITSDLICPWCYVGLRKLQEASKVSGIETRITWKPFFLRPETPPGGIPKGGTPASRVGPRLTSAGESAGINFTGLTDKTPNTTLFHTVMHHLQSNDMSEKATNFQEAVFDAYFTGGIFPDQEGLLKCAKQADDGTALEEKVSELFLWRQNKSTEWNRLLQQVQQEADRAKQRGIHGVPFFEFNGEPAFSGAQDVDTFVTYLQRYAQSK